ncbi:hypothetical protein BMR1_03g02696 [Babesia microti strain RI]|uniref:Uncharacterized protein n=1 Tax=Babesia microti (strain RI) TaxID=1133968 RepID=A0A1R4ABV2_BABMR|nr:hypothetical protein BMR1_03g02696 [Babesia microti strain RI]SJK86492.1 hypothetical protein BMR1_03g02696 [Babesia microti strain RI]|eukprot:XP_021338647.1 hypothetical protein BMR1_03g02696 [Babesia microti strain RI]
MGARKLFSGGKIARKFKGCENPFGKIKSKEVKSGMLDYYRQSRRAHAIIDERRHNFNRNKNKFSLEDQECLENDCSLGDFDEPPPSVPLKSKVSNVIFQSRLNKIEMKVARDERFSKLAEIDEMFDNVRNELSFKKIHNEEEADEFDDIKSKFSAGIDVKITKIQQKNRTLYNKLVSLIGNHTIAQILSVIKREISDINNSELPELLDFSVELVSMNLKKRNDWWDFTHSISKMLSAKEYKNKVYQYFLNSVKIMYKRLVDESNKLPGNDNLQYYQEEVNDWTIDINCSNVFTQLFNGNNDIELATLIFAVKLFPLSPNNSECKLGYIALLLLENFARAVITQYNNLTHLHYEYFTVIYTVALQNKMFIPVLFVLAKEIIEHNTNLEIEFVEEVIVSTAIIIKHLANSSKGTYILSHLWYTKDMECQIKRFKQGHLLVNVMNELRENGLEPLSLLNSQPKSAILEAPKLVLMDNKKKKQKDGLKKAVRREKKRVSKVISQESQVLRDQQISSSLEHKQRVESRYKEILSAAMIEQEEFKKEATRGGDMDTSLMKHRKRRKSRLAGNATV